MKLALVVKPNGTLDVVVVEPGKVGDTIDGLMKVEASSGMEEPTIALITCQMFDQNGKHALG